jgi:hypothetical protein
MIAPQSKRQSRLQVLAAEGTTNFDGYAITPGEDLIPDLFL